MIIAGSTASGMAIALGYYFAELLLVVLSPVLLVALVIFLLCLPFMLIGQFAYGFLLHRWFERTLGASGKRILVVYSRSPNWQSYIESNWLPILEPHVVVLNWSDRGDWGRWPPLQVRLFRRYAGVREFNPMAILFPKRGKVWVIRFLVAFRKFKHGKEAALRHGESELFAFRESLGSDSA